MSLAQNMMMVLGLQAQQFRKQLTASWVVLVLLIVFVAVSFRPCIMVVSMARAKHRQILSRPLSPGRLNKPFKPTPGKDLMI